MRKDVSRLSIIIATSAILAVDVMAAPQATAQQKAQQQGKTANTGNQPARVDLDDLEKNTEKYLGKTVMVEGEVGKVLGPHLFTIDKKGWLDLTRAMPVAVPEPFTAIVQSKAPVRVTGTVRKVPIATIEKEGGIITDPRIKAKIETKPVLVASEVTTVAPAAVSLRVPSQPVGTSGSNAQAPVTDTNQVASAKDRNLVGRRVNLSGAKVSGTNARGFWVSTPAGERIFVMPVTKTGVNEGQTASVEGVVLELPEGLQVEIDAPGEPIYIYAERVTTQ
jgi:uncharacterized protein YdeI (BOF family)